MTPITVIGAGSIGSWTVMILAKMGFDNLVVYDFDDVETHNLNSQLYRVGDIGRNKTVALAAIINTFCDTKIQVKSIYDPKIHLDGIVISAVDSMESRMHILTGYKKSKGDVIALIDPRMGAEFANLHVAIGQDVSSYENTLFTDSDGLDEPCTAKSTAYTANMLAGLVCKTVKDIVTQSRVIKTALWSIKDNDFQCFYKE